MNLFLSTEARTILSFASIEAFKKECAGILLGYRTPRPIIVRLAIHFQTAERRFTEVIFPKKSEQFKKLTAELPTSDMDVLGTFHSHQSWGSKRYEPWPTSEDSKSINDGEVEIIIAIDKKKKAVNAGLRKKGREITVSCDQFYLQIRGFIKKGDKLAPMDLSTHVEEY